MANPPLKIDAADGRRIPWLCLGVGALTLLAFLPCCRFEFLEWDDPLYAWKNPEVRSGLTWQSFQWAWTTFHTGNWHPLTWLSLQLDATVYGGTPAGFHFTNILLHALSAAILCAALQRMTGAGLLSAAAALLFGIHPLRVESVAWISERKDVLSVFFGMVSLWTYASYVARPSQLRYWGVVIAFAASLLSKQTLVTFPCCLLLLDVWPLQRQNLVSWKRLLLEKAPLLALSLVAGLVTLRAQAAGDTLRSATQFPLETRVANAILAVTAYLAQTCWPTGLSPFYPHSYPRLSDPAVWSSGCLLLLLTGGCAAMWRRVPALLIGWLWFLGTLAPMLGITVQFGLQARADRYTYWPHVGLSLGLTWGAAALWASLGVSVRLARVILAAVVVGFVWICVAQGQVWRDTQTLWNQALSVSPRNALARSQRGFLFHQQGLHVEAESEFRRALADDSSHQYSYDSLASLLAERGRHAEAEQVYRQLLELNPDHPRGNQGMGWVLMQTGRSAAALKYYQRALQLDPQNPKTHFGLGKLYNFPETAEISQLHFARAAALTPDAPECHNGLGEAEQWRGRDAEAEAAFREALRLKPDFGPAIENLALLLERTNRAAEARVVLGEGLRLRPRAAPLYLALGMVEETLGNSDAARAASAHGARLDPLAAADVGQQAWRMAFAVDPRLRRPVRAAQGARQVIAANPADPLGPEIQGGALAEMGRYDQAIKSAEAAIRLAKGNSRVAKRLQQQLAAYRGLHIWQPAANDSP